MLIFLIRGMSELTILTDLNELSLGSTMKTEFPNPDDILNFELTIEPDEGMYKGGSFRFTFAINQSFPHEPPKVKCAQKIYHPNIDLEGNVCLNILREDWKPVLNLNSVIVGLQVQSNHPLHFERVHMLRKLNYSFFSSNRTLRILSTKKRLKTYELIGMDSNEMRDPRWQEAQSRGNHINVSCGNGEKVIGSEGRGFSAFRACNRFSGHDRRGRAMVGGCETWPAAFPFVLKIMIYPFWKRSVHRFCKRYPQ